MTTRRPNLGRRPNLVNLGVVLAITALFGCFFVWPLVASLRGAFFDATGRPTLAYVALLFGNVAYLQGFVNALGVAASSTVLATVLGTGVALVLDRFTFPGKRWLAVMVPLPLIV